MSTEKIWLAIVGVKPLRGNEYIEQAGAYVNVACLAENENEFIEKLHCTFQSHKFDVFEILAIENEESVVIDNIDNSEKFVLIHEIKQGYEFSWGTFHTFP